MNFLRRRINSRKVMQVRSLVFHFLPEVLDGIEIRRVGKRSNNRQPRLVPGKKFLHCGTGMIPRTVLYDHDVPPGRYKHRFEKSRLGGRGQAFFLTFVEKTTRKVIDQTNKPCSLSACRMS
jgi:hypothetical protein